ncbi:MAG: hypothetical protein ACPGVW_13265 [Pseudoalteromonas marina]
MKRFNVLCYFCSIFLCDFAVGSDLSFRLGKATPFLSICSLKNDLYETNNIVSFTNNMLSKVYNSLEKSQKEAAALGANEFFDQLSYQAELGVIKEEEVYALPRCERYAANILKEICVDNENEVKVTVSKCKKAKNIFQVF